MDINQHISNQIETQFPQLYREFGRELIELIREYYSFLETDILQSTYHSRKMFEYRDIDQTLDKMVKFFQRKYLSDLPISNLDVRFIVKHILDLYRKKGTDDGIKLFFTMFYNETVEIFYPSINILSVSNSKWHIDTYLEMQPNDLYNYNELVDKTIYGSSSGASGLVSRVMYILNNNTIVPIVFLENIAGTFSTFENIIYNNQNYGRMRGSLYELDVVNSVDNLSGNMVGDVLSCSCPMGHGGKALVTEVSSSATGEISYTLIDGGYGYSLEHTELIVSNQTLIVDNIQEYTLFERVEDQYGNSGIIIGYDTKSIGVKMDGIDEFTANSIIETVDRSNNNIEIDFYEISPRNDSSPGNEATVEDIDFVETISIIADFIEPVLDIPLNANNFLDYSNTAFSGSADPINLDTLIIDAFDIEILDIGRIKGFRNINPGQDYQNDVFAVALDDKTFSLNVFDQILVLDRSANLMRAGDLITQNTKTAIIRTVNDNIVTITPYTFSGFDNSNIDFGGNIYEIEHISYNFNSDRMGINAIIQTNTDFAIGKILKLKVLNSGYGYINGSTIRLRNSETNDVVVRARVTNSGSGFNEGVWKNRYSHIGTEFDQRLHDNWYYQSYSYDIKSNMNTNIYETQLKQTVHPAGTKMFGSFNFRDKVSLNIGNSLEISTPLIMILDSNLDAIQDDETGEYWVI